MTDDIPPHPRDVSQSRLDDLKKRRVVQYVTTAFIGGVMVSRFNTNFHAISQEYMRLSERLPDDATFVVEEIMDWRDPRFNQPQISRRP